MLGNKMGIVKIIIYSALILIGIAFIFGVTSMPDEQQECLEEIAEDYCEDNDMYFEGIAIFHFNNFACMEDERSVTNFKVYKFLDDEIEECEGKG